MSCLPEDSDVAVLVGRVWLPGKLPGPCVVVVEHGEVYDITATVPTLSCLLNSESPATVARDASRNVCLGNVEEFQNTTGEPVGTKRLLAPADLQNIKACGVTFVESLLERVIEEKALGEPTRAAVIRNELKERFGGSLDGLTPGSQDAQRLKEILIKEGLWSQYLEVGLGPDAEVFTKAQPMSAVGWGAAVGLHPSSSWNNPEPELVLAVNYRGDIVGATLGNDVNLRDIEGRSALLLGRAKDNNGSCAIGPFVRLIDENFTLETLRSLRIDLRIEGQDGFVLDASSDMSRISRDIVDLVAQVIGRHHQYPDGFLLFTGTLYAPSKDRDEPGRGFTHKPGDLVTISSPHLGALFNTVELCTRIPQWDFGAWSLFKNLARRGLLPLAGSKGAKLS